MKVINRNINREYEIIEKYEAGISLTGAEVKTVRQGRIKFEGSYVKIVGSEVFLINAEIAIYEYARPESYDSRRTRKLLLHKSEILRLKTKLSAGANLTIVPIACYNKKSLIKLEIALSKGKKTWEKKKVEKNRDENRRIEREMKEQMKY
ncbi:SsrA-binding protein [Candidatus Roizmanbacteria bacterium RIFCSPHIGHO2_02_FULL_37_13b]|uniref:SsrA-binding protein n=1 Tax=Candidatus Roizmanbacteria bacterium RIFCSPLOWO2_02_FULL_36_11 TaxID=1802071 RepID=A0A1F7JH13_9BACT|nr:MAG: SsrA-binding protein [Candidatus Roizmanbacteria bacterium RIFCSPHIGHO2_02_FULL_37_13b]OGK54901.1 MAG: SsrA-binding protein [Candidatus Roizmanbacteria bacterium RIFCSPLOWO2_02_FULL_36_11]